MSVSEITKMAARAGHVPDPCMFKLYIIDGSEVFSASTRSPSMPSRCMARGVATYDLMGKDATMFHHETQAAPAPAPAGGQRLLRGRAWPGSMWSAISRSDPR